MRFMLLCLALFLTACATPFRLGEQAFARGDLAGAERQYTTAIRSGDPSAWNNLGVVYYKQGKVQAAIDAFNMGARYGDPTARANLARNHLPIPAADLASAHGSSTDGMAAALDGFNKGYSGGSVTCTSFGWSDLKRIDCR
jgi:tetratricopeptide (TPR) repeat protein